MLPLMLDLRRLRVLLVGNGAAAVTRLRRLEAAGAIDLAVHADRPGADLTLAAGGRLVRRLPTPAELACAQLVFIADARPAERARIAALARAVGVLTHVEDQPQLSDAQAPAVLRRGGLTVAVSTGGASPHLAAQIRDHIGGVFGPEWAQRLDELAALRRHWRAAGACTDTVAHCTEAWVAHRGGLPANAAPATTSATSVFGSTRVPPSDRVARNSSTKCARAIRQGGGKPCR